MTYVLQGDQASLFNGAFALGAGRSNGTSTSLPICAVLVSSNVHAQKRFFYSWHGKGSQSQYAKVKEIVGTSVSEYPSPAPGKERDGNDRTESTLEVLGHLL